MYQKIRCLHKISSKRGNVLVGISHPLGHFPPYYLERTMDADTDKARHDRDKLRDGPCANPYLDLEECAADKNVGSHRVSCP